ncbi:hypothetical protein EPO33_00875 [Patescibacteria group bacterium]|nr:MAG: hypothetical protein EPO33_00875 [Patescibacteria group bacterium]
MWEKFLQREREGLHRLRRMLPVFGVATVALLLLVSVAGAGIFWRKTVSVMGISQSQFNNLSDRIRQTGGEVGGLSARIRVVEEKVSQKAATDGESRNPNDDFQKGQLVAATSDQYVKDHSRVIGAKVGFLPPSSIYQELFFSRALWDAYPVKDVRLDWSYGSVGKAYYVMTWYGSPRGYQWSKGSLEISEWEGPMLGTMDPALCPAGAYDETHRKIASMLGAPCEQIEKIAYAREAGCAYLSRGETQQPGPTAYRAKTIFPPTTDPNDFYNIPETYAAADIVILSPWGSDLWPVRRVSIRAKRGQTHPALLTDDRDEMIADWQRMVDQVSKDGVVVYADEYGACY